MVSEEVKAIIERAIKVEEASHALYTSASQRIKDPAVNQVVLGVWLRDERGLARPQLPPLVEELDSLPFPDRDLFACAEAVRQTGEIEVVVGRGCPQGCTYCINGRLRELYDGGEAWVRRRSHTRGGCTRRPWRATKRRTSMSRPPGWGTRAGSWSAPGTWARSIKWPCHPATCYSSFM